MNKKYLLTVVLLSCLLVVPTYAEDNFVAKVIILKGQVKAKFSNGSLVDVKQDMNIPEGALLQTADRSFVKLIFIDKSQMNLGPSSQMVINAFPKKEAGIITLVKGQIRSQVTKDYMDMDDKSKSKLYIKTNTAAMGIRGTDFQVNFNPINQNTALITFEGKVAMAHIERSLREERFDQRNLERVVSSEKAVMVEKGMISAVNLNVSERAMLPTLLGSKQIEALKSNESGLKENKPSGDEAKQQFRNPIPPGADGVAFSNNNNELDKQVAKIATTPESIKAYKEPSKDGVSPTNDPNGFFDSKSGAYKLPAGSVIDLATVNIVPPPTNAIFDTNSKTFIVPESFGKIDKASGEYSAPVGLKLGSDGKFTVVDQDAYAKSQVIKKEEPKKPDAAPAGTAPGTPVPDDKKMDPTTAGISPDGTRAPASVETAGALPPPPPPSMYNSVPGMATFVDKYAVARSPAQIAPTMTDAQKAVVQDKITQTATAKENATNTGTTNTSSKVHIIFNAN